MSVDDTEDALCNPRGTIIDYQYACLSHIKFSRRVLYIQQQFEFMFSNQQSGNNFIYYVPALHNSAVTGFQNSAISILVNNQELLSNQVQQLKSTIKDLQIELKQIAQQRRLAQELRMQSQSHFIKNGQVPRKKFVKDKNCPFSGCKRKYSSKIALNAHLRKGHGGSRARDIQQA